MTAGTSDKVALYWYAEPSVLTHRSWCGDYTHTHARMHTNCIHATLTQTHAPTHARKQTHTKRERESGWEYGLLEAPDDRQRYLLYQGGALMGTLLMV